jgi:hypothetical protein
VQVGDQVKLAASSAPPSTPDKSFAAWIAMWLARNPRDEHNDPRAHPCTSP